MNKLLSKINLFLRSLVFMLFMNTFIFLYSFFCLIPLALSFVVPLRIRYGIIMFFNRTMIESLRVICKVEYQIDGLENIPKNRTGIILSKHQSVWETFILPTLFDQSAIILKKELLWVPFFGWGLALVDPIAINRKDKSSAMAQIIKKGKQCINQGRWILVFPEGTRIPVGKVGHYRLGGARLAVETGAPIIPVAHNAGKFWPKKGFIKKPGKVHMVIGPVIETKNRAPEDLMNEVKNWIEGTILKIDAPASDIPANVDIQKQHH